MQILTISVSCATIGPPSICQGLIIHAPLYFYTINVIFLSMIKIPTVGNPLSSLEPVELYLPKSCDTYQAWNLKIRVGGSV